MTREQPIYAATTKLTEQEWRDLDEFRKYWAAFCDADPTPEGFIERAYARGYAYLRSVTRRDLDESFAAERGIEKGGRLWELTSRGSAALAAAKEGT